MKHFKLLKIYRDHQVYKRNLKRCAEDISVLSDFTKFLFDEFYTENKRMRKNSIDMTSKLIATKDMIDEMIKKKEIKQCKRLKELVMLYNRNIGV